MDTDAGTAKQTAETETAELEPMSTSELTQTDEQTDEQTIEQTEAKPEPEDDESSRHPKYTETTISAYGTNGAARSAFEDWEVKPSRTTRRSEMGKRFDEPAWYHYGSSNHFYQFPSGLGFSEVNSTSGAFTRSRGLTGGRTRLPSGENLAGLNIDQVDDFLSEVPDSPSLTDLRDQHGAESNRGTIDTRENFVIEFADGEYLVVLYDGSANRRSRTSADRAGMLVTPENPRYAHVNQLVEREAYSQLSDLVAPDEVLASDLPTITSSEYRNKSGRANAGGYGHEESIGEYIIRQGEWYFVPRPDVSFDDRNIEKPYSSSTDETALGSHVPRDQVVIGLDGDQSTLTDEASEREIYVRGTVRHQRNEHSMFHLYDMWHQVYENTEDMYAFEQSGGGRLE